MTQTEYVETRFNLKRRILIVDDEEVERRILENILKDEYKVLLARDGEDALKIMREMPNIISLVLLDLFMPNKNGFEVLAEMREDEELSKIPVIVLTADKTAEVKCLNSGATDFVSKPYNVPEVIRARVQKTIQLYESRHLISLTRDDALTGLLQLEYFKNYVGLALQYYPEVQRDMIVLNINRFHIINELYGRKFGDELLANVGKILRLYAEENAGVACRAHDDTFYLSLPHDEEPEHILWELHNQLAPNMADIRTRFRMGVYSNADQTVDCDKQIDCALRACNSIVHSFSNYVAYYDVAMYEKDAYEERLISELDRALEEKQFVLYYQPKYAIQGGKPCPVSAEALVRWNHPELGMISPGVFIPLFENNGLIKRLDMYIWKEAAEQIKRWKDKYGIVFPLSVNVSRVDLLEKDFVETICEIVRDAGIRSTDFMLEVTESAYTQDSKGIIEIVNQLRSMGFHISMDDFGSGYSSLNMVSSLPIDELKLDMGFVRHIHEDVKSYKLVEIVMEIAKLLDVKVVAEGVEIREQHDLLKKLGVHIIQGYYYSKPLPEAEFTKFVEERLNYE